MSVRLYGITPLAAAPGRRRRGVAPFVIAAAAAVAVVAGLAIGNPVRRALDGHGAAAPAGRIVRGADFRLVAPPGWERAAVTQSLRGHGYRRPVVLAYRPIPGVILAVETIPPAALQPRPDDALRDAEPGTKPVVEEQLGSGLAVWRYNDAGAAGRARAELFVAPTTDGLLTAACLGGLESTLAADCDGVVATIRPVGADALPLAVPIQMRIAIPDVIRRLSAERRQARAALAGTADATSWASSSARTASAYRSAAASLSPLVPRGSAQPAEVVASLRAAAGAYDRLAAAATAWDRARWATGRSAAVAAERRVGTALAALGG